MASETAKPLLEIDNLTVQYGHGGAHTTALDNISFNMAEGEDVAIVGESGSGKSTFGLAVSRLLPVNARLRCRAFKFNGQDVDQHPPGRLPSPPAGLSMVFQDALASLDPVWTIASQFLAIIQHTCGLGREDALESARIWLARVGLDDTKRVLAARPYELSGGMRQRVMLALALCSGPKLLIADEPTSALDASRAWSVMELMYQLARDAGASVLLITHDLVLSQAFSRRTVVMRGGRILDDCPTDRLFSDATDSYTHGLARCIPTLLSADMDQLPTLQDIGEQHAGAAVVEAVGP
jgi:ABC-type dipeptide/oligopeptide/nickel transport system ATPase component